MEKPEFLDKKYPDLSGSKPIDRAVERAKHDPERASVPHTRDERIQAYLDRIDTIVKDERGWEHLKNKIVKDFVIDTDDEDALLRISYGLYESEKRIAIEQGRGADLDRFPEDGELIEKYKESVKEKREIQERTITAWLDYLHQNDAQYPTWFRYFVVRNLEKMGTLDKKRGEYTKRAEHTIAPFPEINSETLGFVFRMLTTGIGHNEFVFNPETDEPEKEKEIQQKHNELTKLIAKKDFIKLYAFAQIETAGQLNKESLRGEWVKYDQGSDFHVLENSLKGKGTGWCTAEGSAYGHLGGGDFYVYYTIGKGGKYTEPRIAIRMEGDHVAEVRGVNHRQELEPALLDLATEKYHSLPGGEKFDKKSHDMKTMTDLAKKQEKNQPFTRDDLTFLYELNGSIEGFGYERDPRIEELRSQRTMKTDLPIMFECSPEQIAYKKEDLKSDTKAYIGRWTPEVLKLLPDNISYVYESFPDKKVFLKTIETDKNIATPEGAELTLMAKGFTIYDSAREILQKITFSKESKEYDFVSFSVEQLGFPNGATLKEIYAKAKDLGLELCPAEVGPLLRLNYPDQPNGEYLRIAMETINDSDGDARLFEVLCSSGERKLVALWDDPDRRGDSGDRFVFLRRK